MCNVSTSTAQLSLASTVRPTALGSTSKQIAVGQNLTNHRIDAAKQSLVLQFLRAEPRQCFDCLLVAKRVIAAELQDFGVDEPLDQAKDVGVGAALDLAHEPLFTRG